MSKSFYGSGGGDTDFRRKWDHEEYRKKALEREETEKQGSNKKKLGIVPAEQRELLQAREKKLNLAAQVNKTQIVQLNGSAASQPGFYCDVCDCVIKDSVSYYDHINGKRHQQRLGMNMKVERVGVDKVKERLEALKRKTQEKEEYDLQKRVKQLQEAEEKKKEEKKRREKEKAASEALEEDDEVAKAMGFGGFGSTKK